MDVIPSKGLVYYTDNQCDEKIASAVRARLIKVGYPIVSVSHRPLPGFGLNIVVQMGRGILTMYKQILIGLEASESDIIFLVEHDVLYDPTHFKFTPPEKDVFYYNVNTWVINAETGKGMTHNQKQTSGLCAHQGLLVEHYRRRVERAGREGPFSHMGGFEPGVSSYPKGVDNHRAETWVSECPNIDIRHSNNLTSGRFMELLNDKRDLD